MTVRRAAIAAAALLVLAAGVKSFAAAGYYLERPAQPPVSSDLVVALGGDHGQRSRMAAELYHQGLAANVLQTGVQGQRADQRTNAALRRSLLLRDLKVPQAALLSDDVSTNSWEEAVNTLTLMRARGFKRVMVVSDPPHMRRLQWAWGRVFAGSGIEFRLVASDFKAWDADRWWATKRNSRFVLKEYLKLGYYRVVHR